MSGGSTVERSVFVAATPETVFSFFTDSALFASWWGDGSRIDPRPGGEVYIRYPNGAVVLGSVRSITPMESISFTYGYEDASRPIPPGGSLVTISLEPRPDGTLVRLRHEVADEAVRDAHDPGWRFQLALFANVVARRQHADVTDVIDGFFAAFAEPDAAARRSAFQAVATEGVVFRDDYASLVGLGDLTAHVAALHQFMAGMRMERRGEARQCQGTAVCEWRAVATDGRELGHGTGVFTLAPDGRAAGFTGFWSR